MTQSGHSHRCRNNVASTHGQAPCLLKSCPKNGDAPNSPLLTIGSLVPSVGPTIDLQNKISWIQETGGLPEAPPVHPASRRAGGNVGTFRAGPAAGKNSA